MTNITKEAVERAFNQVNYLCFFEDVALGRIESVRYDLETRKLDVTRNDNGWTALHYAAWHVPEPVKAEMVELLLRHGARKYQKTQRGETPLDLALGRGNASKRTISLLE